MANGFWMLGAVFVIAGCAPGSATPGDTTLPPPGGAPPPASGCPQEMGSDAPEALDQAIAIEPGTFDGCLGLDDAKDTFAVTAPEGAAAVLYHIHIEPRGFTACLGSFDAQRALGSHGCGPDAGATAEFWAVVAGGTTAYLQVGSYLDMRRQEKSYALTVEATPLDDPTEPNDDVDQSAPIEVGSPVSAFATSALNTQDMARDTYAFEVTSPGAIEIAYTDTPADIEPVLYLFDANRKLVAEKSGGKGEFVTLQHTVEEPGTFYVAITDYAMKNAGYPRGAAGAGALAAHVTKPYTLTVTAN